MTELFAPVCSITPTKRRRFLWAAWWTAPPSRDPFQKPDASNGGARTRHEAQLEAEKAAGCRLVAIEGRWARAWGRVLLGEPPWGDERAASQAPRPASVTEASTSIWVTLGIPPTAPVDEIKRAYRKRALETHPDRGGDPDVFRSVQRAYEQALVRRDKPARKRQRA